MNTVLKSLKTKQTSNIPTQFADRLPIEFQILLTLHNKTILLFFVSGKKSSNGKVLFEHAKSINPNSYLVSDTSEIDALNIDLTKKIGICGATSTPLWQMEAVQKDWMNWAKDFRSEMIKSINIKKWNTVLNVLVY